MLSILIPTYRYDCTELLKDISIQANALKREFDDFDYEIIVADDCSELLYTETLQRSISEIENCILFVQEANMGRAANRNKLIEMARFPWLLFIDADAQVFRTDFLHKYWMRRHKANVVCGGLESPKDAPVNDGNYTLRLRYEQAAEAHRTLEWRNKHPYAHFTTFNFLIRKNLMAKYRFDSRIKDYGHEDTLLGCRLQADGENILHIDNPLLHTGIDTNEQFLNKTNIALQNLVKLNDPLLNQLPISRLYRKLKDVQIDRLIAHQEWLYKKLRKNLLGTHPSLFVFKVYKVFTFCRIQNGVSVGAG